MIPEPGERPERLPLYAALGEQLTLYDVHTQPSSIEARSTIALPANVQFASGHGSKPILYVATSNRRSGVDGGDAHHIASIATDPATGKLRFHGDPIPLAHRPIHISIAADAFLLLAFNEPAGVEVYALHADGRIGHRLDRRLFESDCVYPHHVQVTPDGRAVVLVARGLPGALPDEPQKAPGSLRAMAFEGGQLGSASFVAPFGGSRFGPRDVAFHPAEPWMFVSLEVQNKLALFDVRGDAIDPEPLFVKDTLPPQADRDSRQLTGALAVHPSGRHVYCANRGSEHPGRPSPGPACAPFNGFTVFELDPRTGEPSPIQHIDSGGYCPRTFSLDSSGRFLAAGNAHDHVSPDGAWTPANLALFAIAPNGILELKTTFAPPNPHSQELFWAGFG